VPNAEEAARRTFTPDEARRIAHHARRLVLGTPEVVRARLAELAAQSQADELMIITITGDYDSRMRSYELVAESFELKSSAGA
jgi:alkanesulfonate monooxygenase SsuD/methylene tetrahydromethanopterin reductase-like flavin-dependent oxidoreductase (luciferase family)